MTPTLFGIRNCDTVKAAMRWLDAHGVAHMFHDYKKAGVDPGRLERWADRVGWEALLNRSGTTFRKLPDADRQGIDRGRALALMAAQPSMIRRPVLEHGRALLIGFREEAYAAAFEERGGG